MKRRISSARAGSARRSPVDGDARHCRWSGVSSLLIAAATLVPLAAAGQQASQAAPEPGQGGSAPTGLSSRCAARPEADPFLAEVARARDIEDEAASRAALEALEPEARRRAEESPNDVTAQYHLAAVMGARLDHEDGADKIAGANELHDQAARVLALAPQHAGASYMMGKMHASVLRLGGFKRFLATNVLGGSALKNASWEQAQALLEVAVQEDPCVPEHHFELARVYAHHKDTAGWERELGYVRELTAGRDGRLAVRLRERADEFEREWRAKGA